MSVLEVSLDQLKIKFKYLDMFKLLMEEQIKLLAIALPLAYSKNKSEKKNIF